MNAAYLHLVINHLPVLGILFGTLLLLAGFIAKNRSWVNAAFVAFVVCAIATVPTFSTGEGAEEFVEELAGSNHNLIHEHEEAAETAIWLVYGLGALSLGYLVLRARLVGKERLVQGVLLVVAVLAFVSMGRTAQLGGKIRRPELQTGSQTTPTTATPEAGEGTEGEQDAD